MRVTNCTIYYRTKFGKIKSRKKQTVNVFTRFFVKGTCEEDILNYMKSFNVPIHGYSIGSTSARAGFQSKIAMSRPDYLRLRQSRKLSS